MTVSPNILADRVEAKVNPDTSRAMESALTRLTPADEALVRVAIIDGKTVRDLADERGVSRSSLHRELSRIKSRILALLTLIARRGYR